jgi:hypothetical protein
MPGYCVRCPDLRQRELLPSSIGHKNNQKSGAAVIDRGPEEQAEQG